MLEWFTRYFRDRFYFYYGQIKPFGIIMFLNYPIFGYLLSSGNVEKYQNLPLRLFLSSLCVPLIFIEKWIDKVPKFSPIYWHFTVILCIPFFFTYMTLQNDSSTIWLMNTVSATFFMLLILDIVMFFIDLILGGLLGLILFYIHNGAFIINPGIVDIPSLIASFLAAYIIGGIFSHNKFIIEQEKSKTLRSAGGAIAHEMRTPLANVVMIGHIIQKIAQKINIEAISSVELKDGFLNKPSSHLKELAQNLLRIAKGSNNLINLLLENLRQDFNNVPQSSLSMSHCLQHALTEFPFQDDEKLKIHIISSSDFSFMGNIDLVTHILFNLIKNSLYFIHAAGKGEILITVDQTDTENRIIFKDTGPGIEASQLPHLFKPFYSQRPHGTGIGLSFCKKAVESMHGKISVQSVLREYTTFTIRLPKIKTHLL